MGILLSAVAVLLAGAGAATGYWALQRMRAEQERVNTLQADLRALCNAAVAVGERINSVERRVRELSMRQDQLGMQQQSGGDVRSFEQAAKLVRKGASIEEVVDVCGLSRGEAELVAMMQRLEKRET